MVRVDPEEDPCMPFARELLKIFFNGWEGWIIHGLQGEECSSASKEGLRELKGPRFSALFISA